MSLEVVETPISWGMCNLQMNPVQSTLSCRSPYFVGYVQHCGSSIQARYPVVEAPISWGMCNSLMSNNMWAISCRSPYFVGYVQQPWKPSSSEY